VIKDGFNRMGERIHKADKVTVISRYTYGGFSGAVKNVFDRSLGYVLPQFEISGNETHHKRRYDEDKAEAFMDALDTGANLKQGDAVLALRQRLLSSKDDKNKATRNKPKLAYIIKAFNYFVAGRELRCLKWNEKSEGMPKVGAIVR
jgi:hypothetical protein